MHSFLFRYSTKTGLLQQGKCKNSRIQTAETGQNDNEVSEGHEICSAIVGIWTFCHHLCIDFQGARRHIVSVDITQKVERILNAAIEKKKGNPYHVSTGFKGYLKNPVLTLMFLPVVIYYIVFHYVPMYGIVLAFKDYSLTLGIMKSPWVGFEVFSQLFKTASFTRAFRNTIIISLLRWVTGFPAPIILALMLNELKNLRYKKVIQTISYLPHFLSWVILAGLFTQLLSPSNGAVNYIIEKLGGKPIYFLADNKYFRGTLVVTGIWKEIGWGTVVYLATIAGIDQELYEAAECDGAKRWRKMWSITLPLMKPTIVILLIMNCGSILSAGFDQIFNLYNANVYETADIIDTYVYRRGIGNMEYNVSTAVGLFKNLIGFFMVTGTNFLAKRLGEEGIW